MAREKFQIRFFNS